MSANANELANSAGQIAASPPAGTRQVSIEERRRLVAESLRIGNPGNRARDLPADADPRHECQIALKVTDIRPYEHNPRRTVNARFAEIKDSIREAGIRNPLTVTRRPGETHFIVESGGNTRLLVVQELWSETREPRFEKLSVLFRPWRSECHVLTAHLVENELRGEMTFWDRATGVIAIKAHLEAEKGSALSLRQLEAALKALGLATNPTSLSHYLFVTERLHVLAESCPDLSAQDIKTIQPRLNTLKRHAQARADIDEATLYASILDPVIRQAADRSLRDHRFGATQLCDACEVALARHLDQSVADLRLEIDTGRPPDRGLGRDTTQETVSPTVTSSAPLQADTTAGRDPPAVNGVDSRSVGGKPSAPSLPAEALPLTHSHRRDHGAITELAQRLARQAGIDEHLRLDPMAPLGFWMIEQPVEAREVRPHVLRLWWLLSYLASPRSALRNIQVQEEDFAPATRIAPESGASDPIVAADATGLVDWILDPENALASATLELLGHVRKWRISQDSTPPRAEGCSQSMEVA